MLASASLKLPLFRVGRLRAPVRFCLVILTRIGAPWRENPELTYGGQGRPASDRIDRARPGCRRIGCSASCQPELVAHDYRNL